MIAAPWLLVVLTVFAVARLTRLVTADKLTDPARSWIVRHRREPQPDDPEDWLVYLVHCRWCASMWLGLPVAAAVYAWHDTWPVQVLLLALAASHATALLAGLEDDDDAPPPAESTTTVTAIAYGASTIRPGDRVLLTVGDTEHGEIEQITAGLRASFPSASFTVVAGVTHVAIGGE